jgi:hypothetical protein
MMKEDGCTGQMRRSEIDTGSKDRIKSQGEKNGYKNFSGGWTN